MKWNEVIDWLKRSIIIISTILFKTTSKKCESADWQENSSHNWQNRDCFIKIYVTSWIRVFHIDLDIGSRGMWVGLKLAFILLLAQRIWDSGYPVRTIIISVSTIVPRAWIRTLNIGTPGIKVPGIRCIGHDSMIWWTWVIIASNDHCWCPNDQTNNNDYGQHTINHAFNVIRSNTLFDMNQWIKCENWSGTHGFEISIFYQSAPHHNVLIVDYWVCIEILMIDDVDDCWWMVRIIAL
jgi:hypothetical protein